MSYYYIFKDTGKPAFSSDEKIDDPQLQLVPKPAANKHQVWDGANWNGSPKTLYERYADFRIYMMGSTGWDRIKAVASTEAPQFFTAVSLMDDNPGMVKYVWNQIINGLPASFKPTVEEIAQWKGIVIATQIGIEWIGERDDAFDFTDEGLMT